MLQVEGFRPGDVWLAGGTYLHVVGRRPGLPFGEPPQDMVLVALCSHQDSWQQTGKSYWFLKPGSTWELVGRTCEGSFEL